MSRFRASRFRVLGLVVCCSGLLAGAGLLRAHADDGGREAGSARSAGTPPVAQPAAASIDFARDIQPIFERHCYECHGRSKGRGRLRLHTPAGIEKGGASGHAIVAGKSEESLIVRRVLGLDDEDRMPLEGDPLPEADIARLRAWIDQGARFPAAQTTSGGATSGGTIPGSGADTEEHWAYVKPTRPALPEVTRADWVRTPIDRFVLARLQREGLAPSREATRAALLRRVTLDLIGLPPTPAELDAFVADTSPQAYEKVVDRLLASPHYGERWARPWLDLARYADTNGHEKDNRRSIWAWRDWVIDALNRDLPFDQFTVEQIAGDMLPNATPEQRIATGFHRNAMTNEEGGVDPDESMYEVLVDRVNTTATVWLGSTLACAQCHNHKYDPFSQKDYFRLLAFFANNDYDARAFTGDGTRYYEGRLDLATPEQDAARKRAQAEVDRLEAELKTQTPALAEAQAVWEREFGAASASWTTLHPLRAAATGGVKLEPGPDESIRASGPNAELTTYTIEMRTSLLGVTGLRLEALPDPSLPKGGPGRDAYGHFRVTGFRVEVAPAVGAGATAGASAAASAAASPAIFTPVALTTLKVDDFAYAFEAADLLAGAGRTAGRKRGAWAINAMRDSGGRVPRHAVLQAEKPFGFPGGALIRVHIDHLDGTIGQGIGRFRLAATTAADPLVGASVPARFRPILAMDPKDRSETQAGELAAAFRGMTALLNDTRERLTAARKALVDLQIPSTLVMKERAAFERPSYELRERGSFTARGARMFAGTPAALHPMRDDLPANRLGLARWLVDGNNPLVARVTVNRLWEQLFGRGLVETSEDFGAQGTPPSHPELLDWLATELVAGKWRQKALLRTIVLSAAYRQDSAATPRLLEKDPYNRLFARGPRFRMEAEMVRDTALAASGLLSLKMHGPSVFPPQPDGIWNIPYNADKWTTSEGEDRYRRGLYTFLRRTSPYPTSLTFDATSREYCTVRRVRTNTPLQALTLLNDPASFEAARALAGRMRRDAAAGAAAESRAAYGFRLCVTRTPTSGETARLVALYKNEARHYRAHTADARLVAGGDVAASEAPEHAAWTIVANVLLNLDEMVTRE
jgi:hypothetical protein